MADSMGLLSPLLARQHIQDHSAPNVTLQKYWGYADRVIPCVNDAKSCAYLAVVYDGHEYSMLYVGIMWALFGGLLFCFAIGKRSMPSRKPLEHSKGEAATARQTILVSIFTAVRASIDRHLLPESRLLRRIFGRTTRLQILILLIITAYITVVSFAGLVYMQLYTDVKNMQGVYRNRTTLGPWSNRIGVIAYALTPFSVFLSNRESLLSLLTGIPYQNFNFLHRWLGYIIFAQSTLHTIAWLIIELNLYQPQPQVWKAFISETYAIWGFVAMVAILILFILSLPFAIRLTGYEVFRKLHYILAMVFIGGCYGHWQPLKPFLIAALDVWFGDRFARLVRTFVLHYQPRPKSTSMSFQNVQANLTLLSDEQNGDVVRLDFTHNHMAWKPGQHFYLCFPESSIWQSHPFTPASLPIITGTDMQPHTYVFRAKNGQTKKIAELARAKASQNVPSTTSVILQGPYGVSHGEDMEDPHDVNVLAVAGGTGVTFILPILQHLLSLPMPSHVDQTVRKIELIWIVRRSKDVHWVRRELDSLCAAHLRANLRIHVFVTRENKQERSTTCCDKGKEVNVNQISKNSSCTSSTAESTDIQPALTLSCCSSSPSAGKSPSEPRPRGYSITYRSSSDTTTHPDVGSLVRQFVDSTVRGPTKVFGSGPGSMVTDLRAAVASCNNAGRVWKGDERAAVDLVCDDRIEW